MSFTLRSLFVFSLAILLFPMSASAQQLLQPESIAPWASPRAWKTPTVGSATNNNVAPPRLVFDSIPQDPREVAHKTTFQSLLMVETECYALLGQIRADKFSRGEVGSTVEAISIAPSTGILDSFPPLGFLRASRHQTNIQR